MKCEIQGVLKKRFSKVDMDKKDGSGTFAIRNFVLEERFMWQDQEFVRNWQFQLKNPSDIDNAREGDKISVEFTIQPYGNVDNVKEYKGVAYESSIWVKLKAISVRVVESYNQESNSPNPVNQDNDDDTGLPF